MMLTVEAADRKVPPFITSTLPTICSRSMVALSATGARSGRDRAVRRVLLSSSDSRMVWSGSTMTAAPMTPSTAQTGLASSDTNTEAPASIESMWPEASSMMLPWSEVVVPLSHTASTRTPTPRAGTVPRFATVTSALMPGAMVARVGTRSARAGPASGPPVKDGSRMQLQPVSSRSLMMCSESGPQLSNWHTLDERLRT